MPLKAHATLTRRLEFAYKSTWAIIVILLIIAQGIIQLTLYQEVATRSLATLLSKQELHSQRMLRNALLLATNPANIKNPAINPSGVDPSAQMQQDLAFIEGTNKRFLSPDAPVAVVQAMQSMQPDYSAMDQAGHTLLTMRASKDMKAKIAPLESMFLHEQRYLAGVFAVYSAVTQEADAQVQRVQIVEIIIFLLSITTLLVEAFTIIAPAMRDYKHIAETLRRAQQQPVTIVPSQETPDVS